MKATVQNRPQHHVKNLKGRRKVGQATKPTTSHVMVLEDDYNAQCDWTTTRVRLERRVEPKGYLDSAPMATTTTTYLDGLCRKRTAAGSFIQEEIMTNAAVPVRSKDVTDFGRLSQAATSLAQVMGKFSAENPPSPEQLESIVRSYQNILEWRRKARESMTKAEGEIDVLQGLLMQFL